MTKKKLLATSAIILLGIIGAFIFYFTKEKYPGPLRVDDIQSNKLSVIAENLDTPWSIAFHNNTALVSSRDTGEIHEVLPGGETRLAATIEEASHRGEGGLLGLAVKGNGLYAYYTTESDNRITRYDITGDPGSFVLSGGEIVLSGLPAASTHSGGRIAFGPDGMLYATVGDAGNTAVAQDRSKMNGKILRMNPDGGVPDDNPFEDSLVYSYGHRNPQGIAWADDGTLFSSEFGQNTWDELNIIEAGGNYGWPEVEGISEREEFIDPVQQWKPSEASPSGIAYADGTIFIANLRGAVLRTVLTNNPGTSTTHFDGELGRIRDVAIAPDGKLWIVTNNTDGRGRPEPDDDRILSIAIENL